MTAPRFSAMAAGQVGRQLVAAEVRGRRRVRAILGKATAAAPVSDWRREPSAARPVIIAGDSIAREFPQRLRPPSVRSWVNRGWPGDTVAMLSSRIDEILNRHPGVLILQIGTNDLLGLTPPESISASLGSLLEACRQTDPRLELYILAIPPIARWRVAAASTRTANDIVQRLAVRHGAVFVDTYSPLADERGAPRRGVTRDGVHLTGAAYHAVAEALERAMNRR